MVAWSPINHKPILLKDIGESLFHTSSQSQFDQRSVTAPTCASDQRIFLLAFDTDSSLLVNFPPHLLQVLVCSPNQGLAADSRLHQVFFSHPLQVGQCDTPESASVEGKVFIRNSREEKAHPFMTRSNWCVNTLWRGSVWENAGKCE